MQKNKRWCAIGDSFTYLNDHLDETCYRMERGYLDRTAGKLSFPVEVMNLGINGSTTTDWLTQPLQEAELYTILLGTNDWFRNASPTGTPEDFRSAVPGTILGNLGVIVSHIRALGGSALTAPIFIMNPVERGDFVYLLDMENRAHGSYEPECGRWLKDLSADIYAGARGENIVPVNLHDEAGFTQENIVHFKKTTKGNLGYPDYIGISCEYTPETYPYPPESMWFTYDGLHPSPVGCEAIAQVLAGRINAWFRQSLWCSG